jgi:hypothetical protein
VPVEHTGSGIHPNVNVRTRIVVDLEKLSVLAEVVCGVRGMKQHLSRPGPVAVHVNLDQPVIAIPEGPVYLRT